MNQSEDESPITVRNIRISAQQPTDEVKKDSFNTLVIVLIIAAIFIYGFAALVIYGKVIRNIFTADPVAKASPTAYLVPAPVQPIQPGHPLGATGLCSDGTYTYSSTKRGACSHHNGVAAWWGP